MRRLIKKSKAESSVQQNKQHFIVCSTYKSNAPYYFSELYALNQSLSVCVHVFSLLLILLSRCYWTLNILTVIIVMELTNQFNRIEITHKLTYNSIIRSVLLFLCHFPIFSIRRCVSLYSCILLGHLPTAAKPSNLTFYF